jgi:hypothetical protein
MGGVGGLLAKVSELSRKERNFFIGFGGERRKGLESYLIEYFQ